MLSVSTEVVVSQLIAKPWFIAMVIITGHHRTFAELFAPIRWDIHHEIHGGEVAGGREISGLKHEAIEQVHELNRV